MDGECGPACHCTGEHKEVWRGNSTLIRVTLSRRPGLQTQVNVGLIVEQFPSAVEAPPPARHCEGVVENANPTNLHSALLQPPQRWPLPSSLRAAGGILAGGGRGRSGAARRGATAALGRAGRLGARRRRHRSRSGHSRRRLRRSRCHLIPGALLRSLRGHARQCRSKKGAS